MTKIFIFKKEKLITGFQIKGHSGYADYGSDIVCSAISTAGQMALVGLKEVLKLPVEDCCMDGFLAVHLADADCSEAQAILQALEKTLLDIAKNHSKFVKMEVKEDVY